jgi:nitrate reductase assembly molybdenum cofactor insertion protein NarJ
MDNQHRKIKGYRELSKEELAVMNQIKQKGVELGELVDELRNLDMLDLDQRWISIGATHLQQGLMALTRAVAKPDSF